MTSAGVFSSVVCLPVNDWYGSHSKLATIIEALDRLLAKKRNALTSIIRSNKHLMNYIQFNSDRIDDAHHFGKYHISIEHMSDLHEMSS